jgi:glycerol-3-phosphate dehydrogenase (NAD(P)+)
MVLARNGSDVQLWGYHAQHVHHMKVDRQNTRFLPNIPFPDTLQPVSSLETCVPQAQDIIIVVPSDNFRETLDNIAPYISAQTRLCWATKGLEYKSGLLLHQVAERVLGKRPLAVLSGPSFAKEVATGLPTAVTIASHYAQYTQDLVNLFHSPSFRSYTTTDLIGVQIGGAIKNVIAIAAGIADGLGFGANTRAALITRGLTEMTRFGTALGGQCETFMGLAGLGDLVLTCTDNQSRNRRFGHALAQGNSSQHAYAQIGQVIEGVHTTYEVNRLAKQMGIDMPIAEQVYQVLEGVCTPPQAVQTLLSREPKPEIL